MKNLMKKIATSLGLTLMVASLAVINHNQAQAKVKKKAGNSAKAKSQAKRGLHLEDISLGVQVPRQTPVSNGSAILQNAGNVKSNARRKNVAGAEGFSIDGTAVKRVRRTTKHTRH